MNKHNWNQLSASSRHYFNQAQNDRMINESYQEGYRQGLVESSPGRVAHTSNRQGQRFDRWGRLVPPPETAPPLVAGDALGMAMLAAEPPGGWHLKRKKPPVAPNWTKMPDEDVDEGRRMYEQYRRRMYEQSGMASGPGMGIGNVGPGGSRLSTTSRPPAGGGGGPRSGEPGGQGPPDGGCDHCDVPTHAPGPGGSLWEWNGSNWFRIFDHSCRGGRCSPIDKTRPRLGFGTPGHGGI